MRYFDFCGKKAAAIALGTMNFGVSTGEAESREYLDAYAEMGGNFIDTARIYGDFARKIRGVSEGVIGRWISDRHNRDSILLATKGGHPDPENMGAGRLDRASLLDDMQRSLDALRTDCVDVYFLHRDDISRPVEEILTNLTELIERGMTRFAAVSNWTPERISEANACAEAHGLTPIYADQPQFSLARMVTVEDPTLVQMDADLHRMHRETQMPCMCFTSQAKGFLTKMAEGGAEALGDKAKRRYLCKENLDLLERTAKVAQETGLSVNSVALAYLTNQPFPCFPIAGASRIGQVLALREAGDACLSAEQIDFLRKF